MAWCETIIAYSAAVNNATVALAAMAGSAPLTTRTGRGKPKITHMMFMASTDDVQNVYVLPQNSNDSNGIPIAYGVKYGATSGFDLRESKLPVPIELPENNQLSIYAQSETAAASVVVAWIVLEYPSGGKFEEIDLRSVSVRRPWEHGAALVSVTEALSQDITSLLPGKRYQLAAVNGVGVNGATAGIVGPAFVRVRNVEMDGAIYWIPLCNGPGYVADGSVPARSDLRAAGMKMPKITGGVAFMTSGLGYTAEQPQAQLEFRTDSIFK